MQLSVFEILQDYNYSDKRIMIGLSGGINSAAALCYLSEYVNDKPKEIYLYYSHLEEHSPDTKRFVISCVEYAKQNFDTVIYETSNNSMTDFCRDDFRGIPQPKISPCTRVLKLIKMSTFMAKHNIDLDIVGYIRGEYSRINRQLARGIKNKDYLISHLSDEDCFSIVKKHIGWYPEIYNIRWSDKRITKAITDWGTELHPKQLRIIKEYHENGFNHRRKTYRVFKHNNCLPCKNMHQWELFMIRIFYAEFYEIAKGLEVELGAYWGRSEETIDENNDCAICSV